MLIRKIPDATPEIISQYAPTDKQALLAKIRYNVLLAGESVPHRSDRAIRRCGELLRQIPA